MSTSLRQRRSPGHPNARRLRAIISGSIAVDSAALITTSVLTAVTGIAFWTVVARLIPPHELGVQTALLSLMTMAGTVAASGAGNAMTAMIPATPAPSRGRLLRQATVVVLVGAALAGVVSGALGAVTIDQRASSVAVLAAVAVGSIIMAFFAFKDTVLTALSVARHLPLLNMAGAIVKIGLVPLLLLCTVPDAAVAATLAAAILTCAVAVFVIRRAMDREVPGDDFIRDHDRRQLIGFTLRDGTASLISMGPLLGAPFLVTWLAGPVQGAMLALMLPISQGLDYVSIGAATALTKHLPTATDPAATITRIWWLTQAAVLLVGAVLLVAVAPVLFGFFGQDYDHATLWVTLALLCVGSAARVGFVTWAAVLRATLATRTLLITNLTMSALSLPILMVLTARWGAIGAAGGLAIGSALLGAVGCWGLWTRRRAQHTPAAGAPDVEVIR
ncbi:hypothetical protein V1Y59_20155 [Gordonia sp. PKS22-38]|uniref:Membrane protein involved in the export of O-antigen and teichoic acid n=1 Tax=Gordonia prachuapensis TaxID=3115651 RepID=A0ABU7MYJ1_9ACTN|nr:hypothetical protein [Gordonia sp. PKS22-38]